jgi:hypothetical protein
MADRSREKAPWYRVNRTSYINNALVVEGDEVQYDGEPGDNLEPINDPAKGRKTARVAAREAAARAREFALRHPEAHIGRAVPGDQPMSHEQAAGISAAAPAEALTPEEVSALETPKAAPRKGK